MADLDGLIASFETLSVDNKDAVLAWLRANFTDSAARLKVIKYVQNNEVVLKNLYCRRESADTSVTFFISGYNVRKQCRELQRIVAHEPSSESDDSPTESDDSPTSRLF